MYFQTGDFYGKIQGDGRQKMKLFPASKIFYTTALQWALVLHLSHRVLLVMKH